MDYQRYSSQFKEAILTKLSQSGLSVRKFAVVLETATLSAVELSEYCRAKGLYPEQIKAWKQACIAGNTTTKQVKRVKTTPEQKSDKNRIKELERELSRKEKALAETAALLVLGKKFDAYWKEKEGS